MYEYLKVMKKSYEKANTNSKRTLLMLNYRASLFALYKAKKITLDMCEFLTIKNSYLYFKSLD